MGKITSSYEQTRAEEAVVEYGSSDGVGEAFKSEIAHYLISVNPRRLSYLIDEIYKIRREQVLRRQHADSNTLKEIEWGEGIVQTIPFEKAADDL